MELTTANMVFAFRTLTVTTRKAAGGTATTNKYTETFFEANPELKGQVVVHCGVEPEVPGELGENTRLDSSNYPPEVGGLHFVFKTWLGDDLVECFPVLLVSDRLKIALKKSDLTGYLFQELEQSVDELIYENLQPEVTIPKFNWFVLGKEKNDFALIIKTI